MTCVSGCTDVTFWKDAHEYWVQCAIECGVRGGEVIAHEIGAGNEGRFEVLLPSSEVVARGSRCSP